MAKTRDKADGGTRTARRRPLPKRRFGAVALLAAAGIAGGLLASTVASAGADTQTVTLGSTLGTPSQNICVSGFNCTYVPFHLNLSTPELQVPFDGTVTSFSVNSGSATGKVELRVLRPAGNGEYTGAGTSPKETLAATGVNTFVVSLPVKAGDVLGLDNDSSAILFDTSDPTYITAVYSPGLADAATSAPTGTQQNGYRLLLSAVVQQSASTTTTTTTGGTTTTMTTPPPVAPALTALKQSHRLWREGNKRARFSRAQQPPVGTKYSFTLNEAAQVRFVFRQLLSGRRTSNGCVAPTARNHGNHHCTRVRVRGVLSFAATSSGAHRLFFDGRLPTRRLPPGTYSLAIAAAAGGLRSGVQTLGFRIVAS